ncbi:MAG: CPBP family intramembrane metalloprotease [Bacteroides sp.]|nr:CPBP family intramembrane metalloprotease [Bacteroides sp.]
MKQTFKLVLYYFGYQLAFTIVASVISVVLAHLGMLDKYVGILNATAIALLLSGIMMGWHLIHFKYITFGWKSFGEVPAKTLWLSIPLIFASMIFINLCSEFIDLPNWMENDFFAMSRNLFGILSVAIMAPVVEEFLFRGAIEGHLLKQGKRPSTAILISALVFGLIHINPAQVPFAFAIGLVFGWLYYRTGSMVPGIIGHFINNSIACIQMATLSKEELNTKTIDMIGAEATYALFFASFIVMIGLFLYMKKHLPEAPEYKEEESLTI